MRCAEKAGGSALGHPASAAIRAVYVGGVERGRDGRIVGVDEGRVMEVVDRLFEAKRQALATGTARHRFPPSLQVWPGPTEPPHAP